MMNNEFQVRLLLITIVTFFLPVSSAFAGIHTWDVVEVFSNADGTVQYIELLDLGVTGTETGVGNGSFTSGLTSYSWSNGAVAAPTNGRRYLIATPAFAALPGAPTPDVIVPLLNVPMFSSAGDTVSFAGVDSFVFGAIPTNGTDAFDDTVGIIANSPTNFAGVTGSVVVGGTPSVPFGSGPMAFILMIGLGAAGIFALRHRRMAA